MKRLFAFDPATSTPRLTSRFCWDDATEAEIESFVSSTVSRLKCADFAWFERMESGDTIERVFVETLPLFRSQS